MKVVYFIGAFIFGVFFTVVAFRAKIPMDAVTYPLLCLIPLFLVILFSFWKKKTFQEIKFYVYLTIVFTIGSLLSYLGLIIIIDSVVGGFAEGMADID